MAQVTFEQGMALEKLSENTFRSLQRPWTWPLSTVVPGGILMALAANAAYQTTASGFTIDTLSCHFLAAPKAEVPFDISVERLSDGGRFCSRVATLRQTGTLMVHVTVSFVRPSSMTGPSMSHTIPRRSHQKVKEITLDDLAPTRSDIGPYMKFQRLPLLYIGSERPPPAAPAPEDLLYTSAAQVQPLGGSPTNVNGNTLHHLALVALSDYHILDCPPTVHGLSAGPPAINDATRTPTRSSFNFMTSLNHSIRFHAHENFRADEVCHIEAWCPWTRGRRAQVESRIFDAKGMLVATCVQEVYFVMQEGGVEEVERKWVMEGEQGDEGGKRSKL